MTDSSYPEKKTGLRHLFAAARYSSGGAVRLLQESAARHEVIAYLSAAVLFSLVGASAFHYLVLTGLFVMLLAIEALNTAIEEVVDHISRDYSVAARNAKDLGSFAVFCMLGVNFTFVCYVVIDLLT